MAHPPGITRHSTKTTRNLRDHLLRSDRAKGRPTEALLEGRVWVRLDPFTRQSADGRYLRTPAIADPSFDDRIHFRDIRAYGARTFSSKRSAN